MVRLRFFVLHSQATPVGKYWYETKLRGHVYAGTTASGSRPREPRAPLYQPAAWEKPVRAVGRLLSLQWGGVLGTIAADTDHHPFGTRMRIPDWGDGVVEDRGGAIRGHGRLDLYFASRNAALRWGRRQLPIQSGV